MDLFIQEVQDKLIKVWLLDSLRNEKADSPVQRLMSPRNIMLLAQSECEAIWPIYGKFLKRLLEKELLDGNSLSDQCVALFRQDWPVVST